MSKKGYYRGKKGKGKGFNRANRQKENNEAELASELDAQEEEIEGEEDSQNVSDVPAEKEHIPSGAELWPEEEYDPLADGKIEIIGVRFRSSGKTYYFDPVGMKLSEGSAAIVETARGVEYGEVALSNRYVDEREITLPLRQVLREATKEDEAHFEENKKKEAEALVICAEKIANHKLDMKLIGAEYTFDNSKLLFYFTADGRVDFRDLVKDLASVFRCRIELRQMGIRDEAKAMGGLGVCGRPYCCASFLPDFVQVSIKMAKEQNLSLNSAKISGACGRLMCCLRYEYDTYLEEIRRTPKLDSIVRTRDGEGIVVETRPLAGTVLVRAKNDPAAAPKLYSRDDVTVIRERAPEKDDEDKMEE